MYDEDDTDEPEDNSSPFQLLDSNIEAVVEDEINRLTRAQLHDTTQSPMRKDDQYTGNRVKDSQHEEL
jgi:hypothetical protein